MTELKPCPFCGGDAEVLVLSKILNSTLYEYCRCGCKECGLLFPRFCVTKEAAIGAWNRRADNG